jgi:hypothetical protein
VLDEPQPYRPRSRLEVDDDDFPRGTEAFLVDNGGPSPDPAAEDKEFSGGTVPGGDAWAPVAVDIIYGLSIRKFCFSAPHVRANPELQRLCARCDLVFAGGGGYRFRKKTSRNRGKTVAVQIASDQIP